MSKKQPKGQIPKPVPPGAPKNPYRFSDFVRIVQRDKYYALAMHEVVRYGRQDATAEKWALSIIRQHVEELTTDEVDDLGHSPNEIDGTKCSNNTTFILLDFCRFT